MSKIYLFDIQSQEWFIQTVTSLNGHDDEGSNQADGKTFSRDAGFPSRRMSACAATGSSIDKTSHNILLIGGQNHVTALADAWVLTLPR